MADNLGERIAGLEVGFKSFRNETLKDNEYIRNRLDFIANLLPEKVDRAYCYERHDKLDEKVGELERDGKYEKLAEKIEELQKRAPAIVQYIVLVSVMGVVSAVISFVMDKL